MLGSFFNIFFRKSFFFQCMINKNPLQPVKNKVQFSGSSRVHKMATNSNNGSIFRPIIVLNLTAEMLYVLNQRMVAQSINHSKQREVISSILNKACGR